MPQFTVFVGEEKVVCSDMIDGFLNIRYKGCSYLIEPGTWKMRLGNLDEKTAKLIGKAIEKHLKG